MQTRFDDSALFYASGESSSHHHIAAAIYNGSVVVEIDLGSEAVVTRLGQEVNNNEWHNLTISHDHSDVTIYLDQVAGYSTMLSIIKPVKLCYKCVNLSPCVSYSLNRH